ncbi:MAG: CAAX amino terminal protease self- immunity [bacterium ADurb.Bin243]|nr:MAG: CAAX amino terminal protease self- immunity [bacterium ADurb.Bin243]HOD41708.1 CPBP family glutamic-type intramembrane protease [Candidatus Wallbacteria bacterium]
MTDQTINAPQYDNGRDGYFACVRKPVYNFLFVLPLLIIYEALIILSATPIRNGADVIVKLFFNMIGIKTIIGFTLIIISIYAYIVFNSRETKNETIYPVYFVYMFAESFVYALALGPVVIRLTEKVALAAPAPYRLGVVERIIASIGAGIYEEFVFRYLLITLFIFIFTKYLNLKTVHAAVFAIFWAALIFSGFHYVGELGDKFDAVSFIFRFIAGIILSILFFLRGYGIAVYTHAIYDLKVFFI